MAKEKKNIHKNLKVVEVDGKKVEFNPEEEEDPRLVAAIMKVEEEGDFTGPMTFEEFQKWMEKEAAKDED